MAIQIFKTIVSFIFSMITVGCIYDIVKADKLSETDYIDKNLAAILMLVGIIAIWV